MCVRSLWRQGFLNMLAMMKRKAAALAGGKSVDADGDADAAEPAAAA